MSTVLSKNTAFCRQFLAAGGSALIAVVARTEPVCEYLLLVALVPLILTCRRSSMRELVTSSLLFTISYLLACGSQTIPAQLPEAMIGPAVVFGSITACQCLFRLMYRLRSGLLLGLLLWVPAQYLLSSWEPTNGLFDIIARTPGLLYRVSSLFGVLVAVLMILIVNWLIAETVRLVVGRSCSEMSRSGRSGRRVFSASGGVPRRSARYIFPPHRAPPTARPSTVVMHFTQTGGIR